MIPHDPARGRHTVNELDNTSDGHSKESPVQFSAVFIHHQSEKKVLKLKMDITRSILRPTNDKRRSKCICWTNS